MHQELTAIVAHRGGAGIHTENSSRAFAHAISLGVDAIECDVHLTACDRLVVFHDPTLDRICGVPGRVRDFTFAELERIPLPDTMGERMPLLRELIAQILPTSLQLSLEVKVDEDGAAYPNIAQIIVDLLTREGIRARTIVHSMDYDFIAEFVAMATGVGVAANVNNATLARFGSVEKIVDHVVSIGVGMINIDHRLLSEDGLEYARAKGLAVTVWTVNSDDDLARWLDAKVDYLTTDRPDIALGMR